MSVLDGHQSNTFACEGVMDTLHIILHNQLLEHVEGAKSEVNFAGFVDTEERLAHLDHWKHHIHS